MKKRNIKAGSSESERSMIEMYRILLNEFRYLEKLLQEHGIDYKIDRHKE